MGGGTRIAVSVGHPRAAVGSPVVASRDRGEGKHARGADGHAHACPFARTRLPTKRASPQDTHYDARVTTELPTGAQISLRVLVRGTPLGEGAWFELGGCRALVVRRSKPSHWPDVVVEHGDFEAVVWTDPARVTEAMSSLATDRRVVAVAAPNVAHDDGNG